MSLTYKKTEPKARLSMLLMNVFLNSKPQPAFDYFIAFITIDRIYQGINTTGLVNSPFEQPLARHIKSEFILSVIEGVEGEGDPVILTVFFSLSNIS